MPYIDTWCDCNWEYRKRITIAPDDIAGDETDFPFLINITDNDLKVTGSGGHVESANGYDIRFWDTSCTTLPFEIEYYNGATGQFIGWVKIPALSSTANTYIYIYYGNDDPAVTAVDPSSTDTWDASFGAVWHMTDLTTASIEDSTINGNDGTKKAANLPFEANGIIYKCQSWTPVGIEYINCGHDTSIEGTHMTIELWVNNVTWGSGYNQCLIEKTNVAENQDWKIQVYGATLYYSFKGVGAGVWNYAHGMSTGSWYHVISKWDGTNVSSRINSVSKHSAAAAGAINHGTNVVFMGAYDGSTLDYKGYMDEVRISVDARSDNWLDTTYFNGLDPTSMITLGAEEESGESSDCAGGGLCTVVENCDSNCGTFRVKGESYDLYWNVPEFRTGVDSAITKNLNRFNFWSGNYKIYTPDTAEQPLTLKGIEYYRCESEVTDTGYNLWDNFYCKFYYVQKMADDNENIQIYGLGDCIDAVYVIKTFRYRTVKGAAACLYYEFILEKVRELTDDEIAAM